MIGSTLQNRYQIEAELGRGGMGSVYRAHDLLLDRDVAVKILSSTQLGSEGRTRLLHEAQAAAKLNHPNIVTIFDAGEVEQIPFIVMELIDGRSLHEVDSLSLDEIIRITGQILAALEHAHANGIVHRDLKPENVILSNQGIIKLMDFGLARSYATRLSAEGLIIGTVFYMAPEMALGKSYDGRVDLYALGVMLYEMATKRLPFIADDPISVISQHLYAPVVPPSTYNPDIPARLEAIILKLLLKEPAERPASAGDVLAELNVASKPAPLTRPAVESELSPLDRLARGRLVGRERELSEARMYWKQVISGSSQVLLISGEPGIGKTRLARELGTLVDVTGGMTLVGECYVEGGAPYAPIAQMVRRVLAASPESSVRNHLWNPPESLDLPRLVIADLIKLAPDLAKNFPDIYPNPHIDPQSEQQRLYESLFGFFTALAQQEPLLLVIEDAHWADSGSLRMIRYIARRSVAAGLRLMIMMTYRETELDRAHPLKDILLDMARERLGVRIKLARLALEETQAMLQALLQEQIAPELVHSIYQETEGNPFFIEEVCKALVEQRNLVLVNGHWQATGDVSQFQIPQSVRLAIESRAGQLTSQTQDVLLVASIVGREFDFQTLRLACDVNEEALIESLEEAERAQLVIEVNARPGQERFAFTHALVPAALREGVSGLRRHRLHRRVARAIEELCSDNYAALAYHYDQAGDEERAFSNYCNAAERARMVYANDEAIRYYSQALELASPDSPSTFDILAGRCRVFELVGRRADQKTDLDRMQVLAEKLRDPIRRLDAQIAWIDYEFQIDPLSAVDKARQAVESATELQDPEREGQALIRYGEAERALGHLAEARQAFETAAERFHQAGKLAEQAICYHTLALVYYGTGDGPIGQKYAETALELSQSVGDRRQEATSLRRLGMLHFEQGHLIQAEKLLSEALVLHRALGDRVEECRALSVLAEVLGWQNRLSEAEALNHKSLEIAIAIQSYSGIVNAIRQLVEIYRRRGELEYALHFVSEQYERFRLEANSLLDRNLEAITSDLLARLGQYEQSLEAVQPLLKLLDNLDSEKTWADVYTFIAFLKMNLGRQDEAREILDQALTRAEHSGMPVILTETLATLGELALRAGNPAELQAGLDNVQRALTIFESYFDKMHQAAAHSLAARLCLAQGENSLALQYSSQAVRIAETIPASDDCNVFFYAHASALHANGNMDQARDYLRRAFQGVQLVLNTTQSVDLRRSWIENVPINRAILQAWTEWGDYREAKGSY